MLGSKTCEVVSISYDVCSAGKYCEEVAIRISIFNKGANRIRQFRQRSIGVLLLAASAELLRIAGFSFIIIRLLSQSGIILELPVVRTTIKRGYIVATTSKNRTVMIIGDYRVGPMRE